MDHTGAKTEHIGAHCPFLNRTDDRCSRHFRLDHLQHAFKFCFDRYKACPVYLELLVERRLRRREAETVSRQWRQRGSEQLIQVTVGQTSRAAQPAGGAVAAH